MLGDRLPGYAGTICKLRDGKALPASESCEQRQPGLSPKAAKTVACFCSLVEVALGLLRDIGLYVFQLLSPSAFVFAEGFKAAVGRNFVKTGFGNRESVPVPSLSNLNSTSVDGSFE